MGEVFGSATNSQRSSREANEDEEALIGAAIERLPTYDRLRTGIIKSFVEIEFLERNNNRVVHREVNILKLDVADRQNLVERILEVPEEDNEKFLRKFRSRIERVDEISCSFT